MATRKKSTSRKSTKKRSNSSRRRNTTQIQIEHHVMREIWAVVYMAFCILTMLSINGKLGFVGELWNSFLTPIFGWGIYAVPVLLGGISVALFFARRVDFNATRILGISLMLASALGTIHLAVPEDQIYEVAKAGEYGGYIGFVSSFIARRILGVTGSYVVFLALFLISVLMTFSVSLRELFSTFEFNLNTKRDSKKPEMKRRSIKKAEEEKSNEVDPFDEEEMIIHTIASSEDMETIQLREIKPKVENEEIAEVNREEDEEEDP
ncbi:MAG: DNA translocase FtsK 4TM domain-containing protein, partial [Candidatus Peregrinibacteria bacterium]|nr:DNA translocase FtsK 4TM domain-containing protein [Candidatus Peregrinibacteria bacterium]